MGFSTYHPVYTLLAGRTLNTRLYDAIGGAAVTSVKFTSATPPVGTTGIKDFSATQDGSIVGWQDDYTYYIGPKEIGGRIFTNTECDYMFTGLRYFDLTDNFNTSKSTSMQGMFQSYKNINVPTIDLSKFDTSKVINMSSMFDRCSFVSLDLSSFNTGLVIYMEMMFNDCSALTELDLSSFNTSSVVSMNGMFYNCSALTTLDLSNFDTSSVVNMSAMFYNCSALTELDLTSFTFNNSSGMLDISGMLYTKGTCTVYVKSESDKTFLENNDAVPDTGLVTVLVKG